MAKAATQADNKSAADGVFLTPSEATSILVGMYKAGTFKRTPLLRGSPGCGKTSAVRAAAEQLGIEYIEINPTMPADEVGGIPELVRKEGKATRTDYALPAWFPKRSEKPDLKAIICLDDALQGDRMMQQVMANLILARNLRGHALPEGVMIVATGNRVEDKAGVTRTLTHFADRMCWLNVRADATAWADDFAIPKGLDQRVIAYILQDKSKLDMFDANAEKCATSRTWEAVSEHLKMIAAEPDTKRDKVAHAVLGGEIGQGEAIKFWAYCQMWGKLPNALDVLKDPAGASINYKLDEQYALVVSIANVMDETNFGAALQYIDRLGPDLTVLAIKVAVKYHPELTDTDAYLKWCKQNQAVLRPT